MPSELESSLIKIECGSVLSEFPMTRCSRNAWIVRYCAAMREEMLTGHVRPWGTAIMSARVVAFPPSLTLPASYHGVYQVSKMKPWLMNSMTDKSAIVSVLPLHLSTQSYGGVGGRPREDDAHVCRAINLALPVVKSLSNQH